MAGPGGRMTAGVAPGQRSIDFKGSGKRLLGLTEAETDLACALVDGVPLGLYAGQKGLSINTVYTHLRHIKAKTGSQRMPELVGKLSAYRAPLGSARELR